MVNNHRGNNIAIIGMACRFPGANSIDTYWENIKNGIESISRFTSKELTRQGIPQSDINSKDYVKAKGYIKECEYFDADFFGYPPRDAIRMDPQIRLLHLCSWEALENAAYNPENTKEKIGAFLGANENQEWIKRITNSSSEDPSDQYDNFILNFRDYAATRVSYNLNLKGPSFTVLTACSTSLVAVHLACRSLDSGECDIALAGGVSISHPIKSGYKYRDGLMVSKDGHCRTFDKAASGTVFGDGIGVVLLKPLQKAIEDNDHIQAIIKGSAINNDGNSKLGYTAPSQEGQERVISEALRNAAIKPESIGYVEAHGTATKVGDPIEVKALKNAYGPTVPGFRKLGSVKTNIGHTNVASGAASLIKVALSLEKGVIPPHINLNKVNPNLDLGDDCFTINTKCEPFQKYGGPRRAGVSAFGFGGTNAHLILEEPPQNNINKPNPGYQLVTFSAKTEEGLQKHKENLSTYLNNDNSICLEDVAFSLNVGRKNFKIRESIVANSLKSFTEQLEVHLKKPEVRSSKKIAFLYPGQGAQYVNMGKDLFETEPVFKESVLLCDQILLPILEESIVEIIYPGKSGTKNAHEKLKQTKYAQPAIFTISYSITKLYQSWGIKPDVLIGHSVGEFVAACVSGVFSLEEALKLVAMRGSLIQALPQGNMIAVPLAADEVSSMLNPKVSLAAINGPSLSLISGSKKGIVQLKERLKSIGVATQSLYTSHSFHSQEMDPILDSFEAIFRDEANPKDVHIPIISTVTGNWITNGEFSTSSYWRKNIRQTVQFVSAIQQIISDDSYLMIEAGPGTTLNSLVIINQNGGQSPNILPSIPNQANQESHGHDYILKTLGFIWQSGVDIDWEGYYSNKNYRRIPLPTYPFDYQKFSYNKEVDQDPSGRHLLKNPDLKEWFYVPTWKRSIPVKRFTDFHKKHAWLIYHDNSNLSHGLIDSLTSLNQNVIIVEKGEKFKKDIDNNKYTIDPSSLSDYEKLFSGLESKGLLPDRIIHLWNYSTNEKERADDYTGFFSLLFLAQVIGKQNYTSELNIAVITDQIHQVIGNESLNIFDTQVLGPIKVIPQEFPNIQCVNIDLNKNDNTSIDVQCKSILAEIELEQKDHIVSYRNQFRWIQQFDKSPLEKPKPKNSKIRKDGVFLITGGLGGLGMVISDLLTKDSNPSLILTTRSDFPEPDQWDNWINTKPKKDKTSAKIKQIKKLIKKGATVKVIKADVADFKRMRSQIRIVEKEFGKINGIIHAAGLPGEGIIQLKGAEVVKKVTVPKIEGTIGLLEIFKDHELDFMMLCSSIASILGGVGLVDYSSANCFMDALATSKRLKGKGQLISVNWDMWGQTGMGLKTYVPNELREWFDNELKNGITSKEGQEIFKRLLDWGESGNIIISTRDLQKRIDLWIKREFFKAKESAQKNKNNKPKYSRPNLNNEYEKPLSKTEKAVAIIWANLFGVVKIGRKDNFFEIGGHSLLATILVNKLRKEFGKNLNIKDVMDNPTVKDIAVVIDNK